jgi:phage/plasmid-associated DNA primase
VVDGSSDTIPQDVSKPILTLEEKKLMVAQHMAELKLGVIQPEFSYKVFKEQDEPEFEKFKKYHDRFLAGEVTPEQLEVYDGDWLAALKAKDRKKNADFINADGFQIRHNEIALLNNRPLTDLGNAERLVDQFGTFIRYCHPMSMWYIWNRNEGRWKGNENGYIHQMSKDVVRRIGYEAAHCSVPEHQKKMYAWAYQCECKTHIYQMSELASTQPNITVLPDDFDKDDMLFNLRNGTMNLQTGQLEPHNKDNNLSKLSDFDYTPNAKCPVFLNYLDRVFRNNPNKKELVSFLQRAVGYTLTGKTDEQCLFLLYGSGANGKSVFLDTLCALLGEYGAVTQSRTFTTNRGEINNDIAALQGKRFVCASENSTDSVLDESIIKQLTGGEMISARFFIRNSLHIDHGLKYGGHSITPLLSTI